MKNVFFFAFAAIIGLTADRILLSFCSMFRNKGWVSFNYKGKEIPHGYGVLLSLYFLLFVSIFPDEAAEPLVVSMIGMSLIGWIDDRIGDKGTKGFRGHFSALWRERRLTTGMLKAAVGLLLAALAASYFFMTTEDFVVDTLLILLTTNIVNLLDLRPGRALKGFWLLQALCLAAGTMPAVLVPLALYAFLLTVFAAPFDFTAKAMLGDSGANMLGFLAGVLCACSLSFYVKIILLVFFLAVHYYAERSSISAAIENNRFLRSIDGWGRRG